MEQQETGSALEVCRRAESSLHEIHQWLLDVSPDTVNRCKAEIQDVTLALETLVARAAPKPDPAALSALLRVRQASRRLRLQLEYASNFCFGWTQLRLGAGYTEKGLPVLMPSEARSSVEA